MAPLLRSHALVVLFAHALCDASAGFVSPVSEGATFHDATCRVRSRRGADLLRRRRPSKVTSTTFLVAGSNFATKSAANAAISTDTVSIAGKLFPLLSKFVVTPDKLRAIVSTLTNSKVDFWEFVVMAVIGWGIAPAMQCIQRRKLKAEVSDAEEELQIAESRTYLVAKLAGQASKIGCAVFAVDCLSLVLSAMGVQFPQRWNLNVLFAKFTYAVWATLCVRDFKRGLLEKYALRRSPDREGKIKVYDRLIDAILFFAAGMAILDILNVSTGRTVASILSIGGIGTLIFSLASKDVVEQLISGLSISMSSRFYEGDEVRLGDGTYGTVRKIGWTHTEFRSPDATITSIPNSDIFNQRVTNLSRINKSQVKQTLWFSYEDIGKMDLVCNTILDEIKESCPTLIRDRAWANWREFEADHLEVVLDAHFNVPPIGQSYWAHRQRVLNAVGRAVKKCGMTFQIPVQMEIAMEGIATPKDRSDIPTES